MTIPERALPLLAVPPSRFTSARSELAEALAAKDASQAAVVRRLRRPVGLAWVLNRLARDHGADVEALLDAAERLREGQRRALSGEGAAALRAAAEALTTRARVLRERAGRVLAEEGRPAEPATLSRIELLLRAAATSHREGREALRRGALVREPEVSSGELTGLALVPGDGSSSGTSRRGSGRQGGARAPSPRAPASEARDAPAAEEKAQRRRARELRELERKRAAAAARAAREEAAAEAAEASARRLDAAARRAAEGARRASERAAALRARAERARREAGVAASLTPTARDGPRR